MKIIYKENPLASHLILDDHDKEILKLKIKLDEMESIICIGEYYLEKEEADKAQKELNTEYVCDGGLAPVYRDHARNTVWNRSLVSTPFQRCRSTWEA